MTNVITESFDTPPYPTELIRKDGSFNYQFTADSGEVYRVQFYPSNGLGTNVRRVYLGHRKGSLFKDVMTKLEDPLRIVATMLAAFTEFQSTPIGKTTEGFVIDATVKAFGPTIRMMKRLAARNPAIRAKFNVMDTTYTWDTARSPIWIYRKGSDPAEVFNGKNVDTPMLVDSKAKPTNAGHVAPVAPTAPAPAPSLAAAPAKVAAPASSVGRVELTSPIGQLIVIPDGKGVKIVKASSAAVIAVADNAGSAEKIIDAMFLVTDLGNGVISYGNKVLWSKVTDNYYQIIAGIGTYRVLLNGKMAIGERESVGSAVALIRKHMGVDSQEQKTVRQLRTILMNTDDSMVVNVKVGTRSIVGSPDEVRHTLFDMNDQDALGRIVSTKPTKPSPVTKAIVPKTAASNAAPPVAAPAPKAPPAPSPLERLTALQAKWKERYEGVNYGQAYIQVNGVYKDNQFSVSWDITERRTTPREIYDQNKYDIGSANNIIAQLQGIANSLGFTTEATFCTFDTIVDDERRAERNGDSLYSEYEQSIGGHLDIKL
jgi:hypothetical protein